MGEASYAVVIDSGLKTQRSSANRIGKISNQPNLEERRFFVAGVFKKSTRVSALPFVHALGCLTHRRHFEELFDL